MWNLFKNIFSIGQSPVESDMPASIQKLVNFNSLNRRKNIRMKYPHFGAFGPYPRIVFKNHEMIVGNVSVGGVLIFDDTEKFGTTVGEVVSLSMIWNDFTVKVQARLVSANLQRRHLQFVDFNPQAFLRLSKLAKPGYLGGRFHRVRDNGQQISAHELWIGPSSESLVFPKSEIFAELTLNGEKIIFRRGHRTTTLGTTKPLSFEMLSDLFVIVANLPEDTEKVKELLEIIEAELRPMIPLKVG